MKVLQEKEQNSQTEEEPKPKKKAPNQKKKIEYCQQIEYLSDEFKDEKGEFDKEALYSKLKEYLKFENGYKWCFLEHNKDKLDNGDPKASHIHLMISNQKGISMKLLKDVLNDKQLTHFNYIHGQFKAKELYLIHDTDAAKADEKFQYDEDEVLANYDYVDAIKKHRKKREKDLARKKKHLEESNYYHLVLNGELKIKDFSRYETEEDRERAMFYTLNKQKMDNAFEVRRKIERQLNVEKLVGEFKSDAVKLKYDDTKCHVFWLYGKPGVGKSLLSLLLAKCFSNEEDGSDIYISNSKNDIFQDAEIDHKIMILEELRPNAFKDNIEELFRVLDNNRVTKSVKRRYKNIDIAPNVIIINSIYDPISFYARCLNSRIKLKEEEEIEIEKAQDTEPIYQFLRRLTTVYELKEKQELEIEAVRQQALKFEREAKYSIFGTIPYRYGAYEYKDVTDINFQIDEEHSNLMGIDAKECYSLGFLNK